MGHGYLWLLNSDGVPYRVTADAKIEHFTDAQWKSEPVCVDGERVRICQIVAAPYAAFALDSLGAVHLFMLSSHLTIRQKVEVYANQRWYPMVGWSSRTLPTDRASFTNEDGTRSGKMTGFQLKSEGWRWEEPWIVDIDLRRHDKEGWEYATNFGAAWKPENGVGVFVRRKRWKRHMRYTSVEKWAEIPRSSGTIVELAVGGFDILPPQECLLFALSKNGKLLRRLGISANNPDGDCWQEIEGIVTDEEREEPSKISCSPSLGTLLVLTWDGRLFLRIGITKDNPNGVSWSQLLTPENNPVAFASLGTYSLWATTVNGKLWMKSIERVQSSHDLLSFTTSKYSEIGDGIYGICVNAKDQLVGISYSGVVQVREGISKGEPAGREFLKIVQRTQSEQNKWSMVTNAGTDYTSLPKHWINDHITVTTTSHYKDTKWRKQILEDLCRVNDAWWEAFRLVGNDLEELALAEEEMRRDSWNRSIRSKLRKTGERRFVTGMLHLGDRELLFQPNTGNSTSMALVELTSAVRNFDHTTSSFTIWARFGEELMEIGFAQESDRDEWHELLQQYHMVSKDTFSKISYPSSLCIPGCMKAVSAGAQGIVWSLAKDGRVYALSPEFSPVCGVAADLSLPQKTEVLREIVEYQRHAFMRGFISFQGPVNGISAWMEGLDPVTGLYDRFPSREWTWIDPEWRIVCADKCEEGWTYSENINGFYTPEKKRKDRFRRRFWQRKCLFIGRGPWVAVESPPIQSIEVQKSSADRTLVWAVTMNGQVLLRQGVTPGHPEGATWKHIVSDYNITSVSVASPTCVWATTIEGRLLKRECAEQIDMECADWIEVLYSPLKGVYCFCASQSFVYILPVSDPVLTIVDVKQEKSTKSLSLPKAIYIAIDNEENLYHCDGTQIVKLRRSSDVNYYECGKICFPGCTHFCFT